MHASDKLGMELITQFYINPFTSSPTPVKKITTIFFYLSFQDAMLNVCVNPNIKPIRFENTLKHKNKELYHLLGKSQLLKFPKEEATLNHQKESTENFIKILRTNNETSVKLKQMLKQEIENNIMQQPRFLLRIAMYCNNSDTPPPQ